MLIPQVRKIALFLGWIAKAFFLFLFGFGTPLLFFQEVSQSPDPKLRWQEKEGARLHSINSQNLQKCFSFYKEKFPTTQDSDSFHGKADPAGRPKHTSAVVAKQRNSGKDGGDIMTVWNGHLVTHLYKSRALQHKPGRRQLMDLRGRERERERESAFLGSGTHDYFRSSAGFSQHVGFVTYTQSCLWAVTTHDCYLSTTVL